MFLPSSFAIIFQQWGLSNFENVLTYFNSVAISCAVQAYPTDEPCTCLEKSLHIFVSFRFHPMFVGKKDMKRSCAP